MMPIRNPLAVLVLAVLAGAVLSGCTRTSSPAPVTYGNKGTQSPPPYAPSTTGTTAGSPTPYVYKPNIIPVPRSKPSAAGQRRPQAVSVGQSAMAMGNAPQAHALAPASKLAPAATYKVKRNDTVYAISRRFDLTPGNLIDSNGLKPPYRLSIGQELILPLPRRHTVQSGDTVYNISRRYDVDMTELMRLNDIAPPYTISVGEELAIPLSTQVVSPGHGGHSTQAAAGRAEQVAAVMTPSAAVQPQLQPKVTAKQARLPAVPKPPARAGSKFLWPVRGNVVSGYGPKGKGYHNDGINIVAPRGSVVRAAENGVVAYAGNELRGFGNLVLVKHEGGWTTAYAHNSQILVRRGQVVKRGQQIARVGSSGNVAEPQLHFEIRKGSQAVDPRRLMAPKNAKFQD